MKVEIFHNSKHQNRFEAELNENSNSTDLPLLKHDNQNGYFPWWVYLLTSEKVIDDQSNPGTTSFA